MGETALDRVRNSITETTAILVTGLWLTLLFVGPGDWWLVVMLVGYVVVVPLVAILADEDEEEEAEASTAEQRESPAGPGREGASDETPLEALRRRYAEGELTDEQFERKLERLLEVETLEDVEDQFATDTAGGSRGDPELERDR